MRTKPPERLIVCFDGHRPAIADWAKDSMKECDIEYARVRADSGGGGTIRAAQGRLIKLAAAVIRGEGFISPDAEDNPASKKVLRAAEGQQETMRQWAIELREIADSLKPSVAPAVAEPTEPEGRDEALWLLANQLAARIYEKRVYLRSVHKTPVVAIGEMAVVIEEGLKQVLATGPTPPAGADAEFGPRSNLGEWPIPDVLRILADAAEHLQSVHNCDCHAWETTKYAAEAARKHLVGLREDVEKGDLEYWRRITREADEKNLARLQQSVGERCVEPSIKDVEDAEGLCFPAVGKVSIPAWRAMVNEIAAALAKREADTWAKAVEIVDGLSPIDELTAEAINGAARLKQNALARLRTAARASSTEEG